MTNTKEQLRSLQRARFKVLETYSIKELFEYLILNRENHIYYLEDDMSVERQFIKDYPDSSKEGIKNINSLKSKKKKQQAIVKELKHLIKTIEKLDTYDF